VESAWVGTAASKKEPSSDTPLAMRMMLRPDSPAPAGLARAAVTPNVVCNCFRFGCFADFPVKTLARTHSYTVVGEYHAYWNASGGLTYTRGATSSIGSYVSISGGGWSFSGYDNFSTSNSLTMGFPSNGAHNSHQMLVSMSYVKRLGEFLNSNGSVCYKWNQIDESGLYDPGGGWFLFKKGKNVISADGPKWYNYNRRHHKSRIDAVEPGGTFSLSRGSALTYGAKVGAPLSDFAAAAFSVGIQAETTHSDATAQLYTAGHDRNRKHYVWGNNANLTGHPEVEYSY
jgi:hypothetical protein